MTYANEQRTNWPSDRIEKRLDEHGQLITEQARVLTRLESALLGDVRIPGSGFIARTSERFDRMLELCAVHSKEIALLKKQAANRGLALSKRTVAFLFGCGAFIGGILTAIGDRLNVW